MGNLAFPLQKLKSELDLASATQVLTNSFRIAISLASDVVSEMQAMSCAGRSQRCSQCILKGMLLI